MSFRRALTALSLVLGLASVASAANDVALPTLQDLEREARARAQATPRVPLGLPADWPADPALRLYGPDVPNVVRAMAAVPEAARPMADMIRAVLFEGSVATSTRAAMGLRIAQIVRSPYVAAHMVRVVAASPDGEAWHAFFRAGQTAGLSPRQLEAVAYAESLTRDIHGVTDEQFARTRAHFTDNEVVELTIAVAFFNHLTRFVETTRLPVEAWAFERPSAPLPLVEDVRAAPRVGLIS